MADFKVTVNEEGRNATYEPPQLSGVEITEEVATLFFDSVHSDTHRLTYDREDLLSLEVAV